MLIRRFVFIRSLMLVGLPLRLRHVQLLFRLSLVGSSRLTPESTRLYVSAWVNSRDRILPHIAIEVRALDVFKIGIRHWHFLRAQSGEMNLPMLLA
jgi:hypothetical protein